MSKKVNKVKKSKSSDFDKIRLFKDDKIKLLALGKRIARYNGKTTTPCDEMLVHYAVDALNAEVDFFTTVSREEKCITVNTIEGKLN